MITDAMVEAAARVIGAWVRHDWDGLRDQDISDRFADWHGSTLQGGKPALRRVARSALEAVKALEKWPQTEDGVADLIKPYESYINDTPSLLSLLYEIDMLPEQTVTRTGAIRLAAICELWKRAARAELSAATGRPLLPPPEGE